MVDVLRDIIAANRAGQRVAIPSVCSAQPDVLRASLQLAHRLGRAVVIEATSNQVNQDGGYMGMTPADFVDYVHNIADTARIDRDQIILGGDHLGTQAWRDMPADAAMAKARALVAGYSAAGFRKIHLDCAEGCAGEDPHLPDAMTAARSADLARVCTETADDLLFVIGTEVPPPGGARIDESGDIVPTTPDAARQTLDAHDDAFGDMAPMIGGLVVQPGVEFSPTEVHALPPGRDPGLKGALRDRAGVCLEAHSTDYQSDDVFPRLAELGFAFQKVGPALTFAYRTALYALDQLRGTPGALRHSMEQLMLAHPAHWQDHYRGDAATLAHLRHQGLADRIRYYWAMPEAQQAISDLMADLPSRLSDATLRTVFDDHILDRAEAGIGPLPQRLIEAQIEAALAPYFFEATP